MCIQLLSIVSFCQKLFEGAPVGCHLVTVSFGSVNSIANHLTEISPVNRVHP